METVSWYRPVSLYDKLLVIELLYFYQVQIDPYLEESLCSDCKLAIGPYFCRNQHCFKVISTLRDKRGIGLESNPANYSYCSTIVRCAGKTSITSWMQALEFTNLWPGTLRTLAAAQLRSDSCRKSRPSRSSLTSLTLWEEAEFLAALSAANVNANEMVCDSKSLQVVQKDYFYFLSFTEPCGGHHVRNQAGYWGRFFVTWFFRCWHLNSS